MCEFLSMYVYVYGCVCLMLAFMWMCVYNMCIFFSV